MLKIHRPFIICLVLDSDAGVWVEIGLKGCFCIDAIF